MERRRRRSNVICCQKCLATQQSAGRPLKAITCWLIFMGTTEHTGKQHSSGAHRHISVWSLIFREGEVVSQHVEFLLEHKPLCIHCSRCWSCLAIFWCHFYKCYNRWVCEFNAELHRIMTLLALAENYLFIFAGVTGRHACLHRRRLLINQDDKAKKTLELQLISNALIFPYTCLHFTVYSEFLLVHVIRSLFIYF